MYNWENEKWRPHHKIIYMTRHSILRIILKKKKNYQNIVNVRVYYLFKSLECFISQPVTIHFEDVYLNIAFHWIVFRCRCRCRCDRMEWNQFVWIYAQSSRRKHATMKIETRQEHVIQFEWVIWDKSVENPSVCMISYRLFELHLRYFTENIG